MANFRFQLNTIKARPHRKFYGNHYKSGGKV